MNLSDEQKSHLNTILNFEGPGMLFITGSAGTGKSTLIKALQDADKNQITLAPTGVSAIQARGVTINSFIGLKPNSYPNMSKKSKKALKNANRIIIDEISMVRSDLMQTTYNTISDELNGKNIPFIFFGDLSQIESVVKSDEKQWIKDTYGSHFFFDADCVKKHPVEIIKLNTIYRQKGEIEYIEALQSLREGDISKLDIFNKRIDLPHDDAIRITYTNKRAEIINQMKLQEIDSPSYGSNAVIEGNFSESNYPTSKRFIFKLGARVMLL